MDVGVFFGFALAGYVFLSQFHLTRDRFAHRTGYELLFVSAASGLMLTLLITGAARLILEEDGDIFKEAAGYNLAVLAVLLGWGAAYGLNRLPQIPEWRKRTLRKIAADRGDLMELLLDDALRGDWYVELSLKNGKVYVGMPTGTTERSVGDETVVEIIPLFSGFRSNDTHEVRLVRYYGTDIALLVRGAANKRSSVVDEDFRVVIPLREVVSARLFDPEIYSYFNSKAKGRGGGLTPKRFEDLVEVSNTPAHTNTALGPSDPQEQANEVVDD